MTFSLEWDANGHLYVGLPIAVLRKVAHGANPRTAELQNLKNINKLEYSQPLCTSLQIALVNLLESFGVVPDSVVGHSSGEIAAA